MSWRVPCCSSQLALADISRSALCCHSNETRALIANPPNAQLEGTPIILPSYIQVRAVVWQCDEGQTHTDTQTAVANIHFSPAMPHAKCNKFVGLTDNSKRDGELEDDDALSDVTTFRHRHHDVTDDV